MTRKPTHEELMQRIKELETEVFKHKQAEAELRESERKAGTVLDNIPDIILTVSHDGTILSINRHYSTDMTVDEIIGKKIYGFITPDHADRMKKRFERAFQTGKPDKYEEIGPGPEGLESRWYIVRLIPIEQDNQVVELMHIATDITERKQAEEALSKSEERYRSLVENIDFGVTMIDSDHNIVMTNVAQARMFKKPVHEFIGKKCFQEYEKRENVCTHCPGVQAMSTGHTAHTETEGVRDDGTRFPANITAFPILSEEGHPNGFIEVVEDITERKKAEETLRASEERLQLAAEVAQMGLWDWDIATGKVVWSQQCLALYGLPPDTPMSYDRFLQTLHPEDRERIDNALHRAVEDCTGYDEVKRTVWPDGSIHWTNSRGKVYCNSTGQPIRIIGVTFDITKGKEAEEALKESEARYMDLYENAPDMYASINAQTALIEACNITLANTLGYSKEEIIGRPVFDIYHPDCLKEVKETFKLFIKSGEIHDKELQLRRKDGSEIDVSLNVSAVRDEDGHIIFSRSTLRDITERKEAENALRESEEKYRQLVRYAPSGIYEIDYKKGKLISVNEVICEFTGYTQEELLSITPFDLLSEESKEQYNERLKKILSGEQVSEVVELKIRRKDGKEVWALFNIRFMYEGKKIEGATVVVHDINDRKLMEEALRESEEKHRTALEASPDPIVVYDMEGKVTYFNPAFTHVFGWTLEERLGKKMDVFVPEETWSETKIFIEKVRKGERISNIETRRYTKKGEIIPVSLSGAAYRDQDGNPLGSVINLRDIREQKRLESQLQQSQKMQSLGTLAGGIAHDFNNLLMGIQGRTSMILMDIDLSHPHFEHLKGIENYVKSAASLTKQLLGFARGGKYEVKPTNLNELIKKENQMFGRTRKEITISGKYEKNLWTVDVDQGQIEQVLLNIYVNAWQAMPEGGDLFVRTKNITIDESYSKPFDVEPGQYVKISVTDTGIGMDETTQLRIFDPFFTTKEVGKGTGLGLSSAYGIIKNHGGFINVYSKKGEGATFNIYLPVSEKEIIKEKAQHEEILRGTETVLLVDDEDIIIDVGRGIIEKLGYKVLVAKNGKEAIEIYKKNQNKIDMVILDMIMPDMGGGDTYDRLKEIDLDIKVLLSSGYSINGQATKILKRGCDGFIQKPFNMVELSKKIRELLDE